MSTSGPAAARSRGSNSGTLVANVVDGVGDAGDGVGVTAHSVTSFPPMDTVIRSTSPGCAARNSSAASIWVCPS